MKSKSLVLSLLLIMGCCYVATAKKPAQPATTDPQSENAASDAASKEIPLTQDPIWLEATADGSINFDVFGRYARDDKKYGELMQRFQQADTTLSPIDLFILYYGSPYRDQYNGGYGDDNWTELVRQGDYEEAYEKVKAFLEKKPASPHALNSALGLANLLVRPNKEVKNYRWRLSSLLGTILLLGDATAAKPAIVTSVQDEYTLAYRAFGVKKILGQQLTSNAAGTPFDVLTIVSTDASDDETSEIWFDIAFPAPMITSPSNPWAEKIKSPAKAQ